VDCGGSADAPLSNKARQGNEAVNDVGGFTLKRDPMSANQPDRIVREPERRQITGIPTSSWYALQAKGWAPRPFPLTARSVGWSLNELTEWIEARKAKRADTWQALGGAAACVVRKLGQRR